MNNTEKKPIIGLLGAIGSGKSAVAAEFEKLGCKTIDADKIGHELLEQNGIKQQVIDSIGKQVLDCSGKIDRKKLADIVFNDKKKLSMLNSIIHPPVLERTNQLIEEYNRLSDVKGIVVDMPLLLEVGFDKRCDKLIFVKCEEKIRADRVRKTELFDKNQLKIRENFQISLDNKASIADNSIDNSSDYETLVKQVAKIFSDIFR